MNKVTKPLLKYYYCSSLLMTKLNLHNAMVDQVYFALQIRQAVSRNSQNLPPS